jgi:hypothetical protein
MRESSRTEYDVRTYDKYGDAIDVECYDSLAEAELYYNQRDVAGEVVGVELERHTTYFHPRESVYKSIRRKGCLA